MKIIKTLIARTETLKLIHILWRQIAIGSVFKQRKGFELKELSRLVEIFNSYILS